ncbi:MAG: hypothetical protein JNM18_25575 [Planctomycetaceae bacterium]|nr:hypothetical protein [Planctomycetaceae bacterium]
MSRSPRGFDITAALRIVCVDITTRLPELQHIDMGQVALRFCQTRRAGRYGVQASLTPLRFQGGSLETLRRGRPWTIQRLFDRDGREMLYLLSFYAPRFIDLPLDEKLATICHELWHIGPDFDGDLRRHEGRCYAHGSSEERFHAAMHDLARRWLALHPPTAIYDFLHHSFADLARLHGSVYGTKIATPKLIRKRPDDSVLPGGTTRGAAQTDRR